eukprot:g4701.t1
MEMTKGALREICKKNNLYNTPELNEKLHLHFKGWYKIQNLDEYTGLRCLYMEGNGLKVIEGLEKQVEMRSLFLQENLIEKMEGFDGMPNLDTLNLNQNYISCIENIGHLTKLRTLCVGANRLKSPDDIRGLLDCPSISTLDLKNNKLEDSEVLDIIEQMPNLAVLYLKGNPVVGKTKFYRKTLIARLPRLKYLDERPVFEKDRLRAEAFVRGYKSNGLEGGRAAEKVEMERQRAEEKDRELRNLAAFDEMIVKAREERETRRREREQRGEIVSDEDTSVDGNDDTDDEDEQDNEEGYCSMMEVYENMDRLKRKHEARMNGKELIFEEDEKMSKSGNNGCLMRGDVRFGGSMKAKKEVSRSAVSKQEKKREKNIWSVSEVEEANMSTKERIAAAKNAFATPAGERFEIINGECKRVLKGKEDKNFSPLPVPNQKKVLKEWHDSKSMKPKCVEKRERRGEEISGFKLNPFSGEPVLPTKESATVSAYREARWSPAISTSSSSERQPSREERISRALDASSVAAKNETFTENKEGNVSVADVGDPTYWAAFAQGAGQKKKRSGSKKEEEEELEKEKALEAFYGVRDSTFIESSVWKGSKKGYYFRLDKSGLGYYKDKSQYDVKPPTIKKSSSNKKLLPPEPPLLSKSKVDVPEVKVGEMKKKERKFTGLMELD